MTTASTESVSGRKTEDPPWGDQDNGAGGKYRVGGTDTEESAVDNAKWSWEETEDLASEEEAKIAGGREVGVTQTEMTKRLEGSGA